MMLSNTCSLKYFIIIELHVHVHKQTQTQINKKTENHSIYTAACRKRYEIKMYQIFSSQLKRKFSNAVHCIIINILKVKLLFLALHGTGYVEKRCKLGYKNYHLPV